MRVLCEKYSILIYAFYPKDSIDHIPFNSQVWKNTPANHSLDSIRLRMVKDFIEKNDVNSMSRNEVVTLLGEPDQTEYFTDYDLVYCLGQESESYFGIDSEWLVFDINDSDQVMYYLILTD